MSRIVAGLQRARLVRQLDTQDKRRMLLQATSKGTTLLQEGRKRRVQSLARALQSLNQSESRQLLPLAEILERIVREL
jgi:DNA-binding MarR family transcriptional regulator